MDIKKQVDLSIQNFDIEGIVIEKEVLLLSQLLDKLIYLKMKKI